MDVLDIRQLTDEVLALDEPLEIEWLETQLTNETAAPTGEVGVRAMGRARLEIRKLEAQLMPPPIRIVGEVTAPLAATCVRCLADIDLDVLAEIDVTLFPDPGDSRAPEVPQEDLDNGTYDSHQIDLPSIVREAILLDLTMHPHCSDEAACTERTKALLAEVNRDAETP